jgi:Fur family ferric uptake transcriptional regulator
MYIKLKKNIKNPLRIEHVRDVFEQHPGRHFAVRDIYAMLIESDLHVYPSAIYRFVNMLSAEKTIKKRYLPDGKCVYEKMNSGQHDRMICTECASSHLLYEERINSLLTHLAEENHVNVEKRELVIYVSCLGKQCPKSKRSEEDKKRGK